MNSKQKIVTISIPEYSLKIKPDYEFVGKQIDEVLMDNFEGTYLLRALSMIDHPNLTLDKLAEIITKTGTDKYDPNRKSVAHEEFAPYQPDLQAGEINITSSEILHEGLAGDIKLFYENTLIDRGYRLRIDLIVLYDPKHMAPAKKVHHDKLSVAPQLEKYLWKFSDSSKKPKAVKGIIKIL